MTESNAPYVGLPEDLAPLRSGRHNPYHAETSPQVRITNSGITLTTAALSMIGQPAYVSLSMGEQSRALAIHPSQAKLGMKISLHSGGGRIELEGHRLGIPRNRRGHSLRFVPQLVEGALLIGPLPAAKGRAS